MFSIDPDAVAVMVVASVFAATVVAGFLMRRAPKDPVDGGEKPDLEKLIQNAPYHHLGNNVLIVK